MHLNSFDTLVEAQQSLIRRGYNHNFQYKDGKIVSSETQTAYGSDQLEVKEFHRFEGMTNPGDMSIIYGIEAHDGAKGVVVSTYGPYANEEFEKFMEDVPMPEDEKIKRT